MKSGILKIFFIVLHAAFSVAAVEARTITVTVPVLPGAEPGAREAVFTWEVLSANGQEPIVGTYACGSFWVAPASGDSGVRLISLSATSGGVAQPNHISLDADPMTERRGLLNNNQNYGNYDASEALQGRLPYVFTATSLRCVSLVAALQRNETEAPLGGTSAIMGERVDAYAILTVLSAPPPNNGANSIRPNITGATKEFLTLDDFDFSKLGSFASFPALSTTQVQNIATRWRHSTEIFGLGAYVGGAIRIYSEGGRAFRASNSHDEYGAGMNNAIQNDILALFNNSNTFEQKKPALASLLAFALDLYHARYNYGASAPKVYTSGAGQHAGKLAPLLLLASLARDQSKAAELSKLSYQNHDPSDPLVRGPQEIRQIRRGVTGVLLWGDQFPYTFSDITSMPSGSASRRYWSDLLASKHYNGQTPYGDPNTGQKTAGDPYGYIDGPPNYPGYAYMAIGGVATQGLAAIMILMPATREILKSDDVIEFSDRFARHGTWAAPDPVAPPPANLVENIWNPGTFPGTTFGRTWGPRTDDVRLPIEGGSGQGRFASTDKHGKPLSSSYLPSLVRNHWDSIIARYNGERFEDNLVSVSGTAKPDIVIVNGTAYISHPHPHATIYYTTNGSNPNSGSQVYSGPITVGSSTSISAMATVPSKTPSAIRTFGVRSQAATPPTNARIQIN